MSASRRHRRQKQRPPGWDMVFKLWKQGRFARGFHHVICQHDSDCPYPQEHSRCTCVNGPDIRVISKESIDE